MQRQLDVVIVSWAKDEPLRRLTENAIETCRASSRRCRFDVLVVETNPQARPYADATTIYYPHPEFNYNRALNLGVAKLSGPYVACCNNDLVFHEHWAEYVLRAMSRLRIRSVSPLCPWAGGHAPYRGRQGVAFGSGVRYELAGWCIALERSLWHELGGFDETCDFWCSDDVYALQLQRAGVRHALVLQSVVAHLGSQTLEQCEDDLQARLTVEQHARFERYARERRSHSGDSHHQV
jgi:hypothetical protein